MSHEWLTVPEVARRLRVDLSTVRRWISLGTLPAITLPSAGQRRVYRIHHTTLEALLSQKHSSTDQQLPHS